MIYNYEFLDETVEVEISNKWMEVLLELDKREYNNNHTETRRHISLDLFDDRSEILMSSELDPTDLMVLKEETQRVEAGILSLTKTQQEVINYVCLEGKSISDFATYKNISVQAVYERLRTARKRLKKLL